MQEDYRLAVRVLCLSRGQCLIGHDHRFDMNELVSLPRLKFPLRRTVLEERVHVNFSAGDLRLLLVATGVTRPPSEGEVHQACTPSGAVPCQEFLITHRSIGMSNPSVARRARAEVPSRHTTDPILPLPSLLLGLSRCF